MFQFQRYASRLTLFAMDMPFNSWCNTSGLDAIFPFKSQYTTTAKASEKVTLQVRVIVLPSSRVMFVCVEVTLSTGRRKKYR